MFCGSDSQMDMNEPEYNRLIADVAMELRTIGDGLETAASRNGLDVRQVTSESRRLSTRGQMANRGLTVRTD